MGVRINEVTTDISIEPGARGGAGGSESGVGARSHEVLVEELRAVVRELVAEELERRHRRGIDR